MTRPLRRQRRALLQSTAITLAIMALSGAAQAQCGGPGTQVYYGGTLDIQNGVSIADNADLEGGLTFHVGANATGTYAGEICSPNEPWGIFKSGAGTLILSNANTFDMGAVIREGALQVTNGSALGRGQITLDGGTLQAGANLNLANYAIGINTTGGTIDTNGYSLSFAGLIYNNDGAGGTLTKTGAGTLTLSGESTYSGATIVDAGTLRAAGVNRFSSNSTFAIGSGAFLDLNGFNQRIGSLAGSGNVLISNAVLTAGGNNANTVFSGVLSGVNGGLTKDGTGTLTLSGVNTYSGPTLIQAGTLQVDGSIASQVTVNSGATLSGVGEIAGNLLAKTGSFVAPARPGMSLTVDGSATFQAGSTYRVQINPAGSALLNVTGIATLDGGTLDVAAARGVYREGSRYTVLTADGGILGTFDNVTSNLAFLRPELEYDPNKVDVTLTRNGTAFSSVGASPNQFSVAGAIEGLGTGNPVVEVVLRQSTAGARQAFNALSGEVHSSGGTSTYTNAGLITDTLMGRLRGLSSGPSFVQVSGVYAAYAADRPRGKIEQVTLPYPELDPRVFTLWGEGFGSWGRMRADANTAALDSSTGGFIVGAEYSPHRAYRVGIAGGFTRTTFNVDALRSSGSNESISGTLYGSAAWGDLQLRLGTTYAANDIDTKRNVVLPGFVDQLSASYSGSTLQAFGELGYRIDAGRTWIEPFIGVAAMRLHTDGFTENGGPAALTGFAQDQDLGTTTLGVRAEARLSDIPVSLRGLVGWRHAYGDVNPSSLLAFAGSTSAFTVTGTPIDRNALVTEAGLDWRVTKALTLGASYQGQLGSRAQEHALKGNFFWRF